VAASNGLDAITPPPPSPLLYRLIPRKPQEKEPHDIYGDI
jgi:hypothetical protein